MCKQLLNKGFTIKHHIQQKTDTSALRLCSSEVRLF